jgi:leucyl/phenylalanyl-tRNA--protein transferase
MTRLIDLSTETLWQYGEPGVPRTGPVAFGGQISSVALLAAYRQGLLPMPCQTTADVAVNELLYASDVATGRILTIGAGDPTFALAWWSPDPRPVLTMDTVRLGSGLAKVLRSRRRWTTTVDTAFERVLACCRGDREPCWLTDGLIAVMTELHQTGWYHSVEVWSGVDLVGGAVGLAAGGVFSCDTMFRSVGGASRIALVDLAARLATTPAPVLDLQWDSPHVRELGARYRRRRDYLPIAATMIDPVALPTHTRSVDDLLQELRHRTARAAL